MSRQELARFLRDRREKLRPADLGLPAGTRRRTPGLRREEVAGLAAVSVDYYVRLEQARGPHPSARVLDAVAGALRLSPAERAHVFRLAGTDPAPPIGPVRTVRPHVAGLLTRLPETGVVVTDATYTVLARNPLADALLGDFGPHPNLARRYFLQGQRAERPEGGPFGPIAVARLRAAADRYPRDEPLRRLLADLRERSEEFRELWRTHPVHAPGHRRKTLAHPDLGRVRVNCDVLAVPEDDQQIAFVTADPGTPSARALRHLVRSVRPHHGGDLR
ncbi:helix-turn-helix transcriptional regulator [Amycolatopsis dongchuanensis]|uniref:Helix-turn-helix transcriptional regulator n=1 Tax=Amycolatopsis dongchuanensis TaxID=1070866 RepID=A0ABP9QJ28_9PSEU